MAKASKVAMRKLVDGAVNCQYCLKAFMGPGIGPHEKFCKKRPDHAEVIKKHRALFNKDKAQTGEAEISHWYAPQAAVRTAYEWFQFDSALFNAVTHLLAIRLETEVEKQLEHLAAAREMITLKMDSLSE
jgi:hypothetical protein